MDTQTFGPGRQECIEIIDSILADMDKFSPLMPERQRESHERCRANIAHMLSMLRGETPGLVEISNWTAVVHVARNSRSIWNNTKRTVMMTA